MSFRGLGWAEPDKVLKWFSHSQDIVVLLVEIPLMRWKSRSLLFPHQWPGKCQFLSSGAKMISLDLALSMMVICKKYAGFPSFYLDRSLIIRASALLQVPLTLKVKIEKYYLVTRAIHLNWPYLKKMKSRHWFPSVDYCNLRLITLFGLKGNLWRKIIAISDFAFPFCALLAFNGKIGNWALKRESPFLRGIQQIFTRWKKKKRRRKRLKIWVVLSSIRRRGSRSKECRLSPSSSARELAPHMPWMGPHLRIFGGFHVPSTSLPFLLHIKP